MRLDVRQVLGPRRLRYAWLAAALMWGGWLASLLLGHGSCDLAGQPIANDFAAFYTAGRILVDRQPDGLYDLKLTQRIQDEMLGCARHGIFPYLNPPFYALVFVPLAYLPYRVAAITWILLGVLALWLGVHLLDPLRRGNSFVWFVSWFPVFAAVSFGQNTPFSFLILVLVYLLWRGRRTVMAGVVLSLLLYKPQLAMGIVLLWLLRWRKDYRALLSFSLGAVVALLVSLWLSPTACRSYVEFLTGLAGDFFSWPGFPLWHAWSVRAFWHMLLPKTPLLVDMLSLVAAVIGIVAYVRLLQTFPMALPILFAGAICLTIWITPYVMVYDWALLGISALILWSAMPKQRRQLVTLFAVLWVGSFLAVPITLLQLRFWPIAVQLSVPILALVLIELFSPWGLLFLSRDSYSTSSRPQFPQ